MPGSLALMRMENVVSARSFAASSGSVIGRTPIGPRTKGNTSMLVWKLRPIRMGSLAHSAVFLSRHTTSRIGGNRYLAYMCAK